MKPIDARSLSDGETLTTTVCVVGAGAAGISLAAELAGSDVDVLLLESGGYENDGSTIGLYRGTNVGRSYFPLESCRLRYFGGTTNHWAGVCRELDPIDFELREGIPWTGWPIDGRELDPYYERGWKLCELGPRPARLDAHPFGSPLLETQPIHFSPPTRFGSAYRSVLEEATNVRVALHANAVEIEPARDAERVARIHFATLEGRRFHVEAKYFVLALGGLETPRLMLASRSVRNAGVGNHHDLVGRFFMEHPHVNVGQWLLTGSDLHRPIYDWPDPNGGYGGAHMGLVTLSEKALRSEGLVGWTTELKLTSPSEESPGFQSLRALIRTYRKGGDPDYGAHLRVILDDLGGTGSGLWEQLSGQIWDPRYELRIRSEQVPNPDSRVMLGDELDELGMPRIALDWRLEERDLRTIHRGLEILATEVGRLGWGRVQLPEPEDEAWQEQIHGGWHHMGTTRMAADEKQGVVDRDCRVHGLGNLFVAGSSVFPTGGWANPTLTLVALAVRTGRKLREELGARGGATA